MLRLLIILVSKMTFCHFNLLFLQENTNCGTPIECYLSAVKEIQNMKNEFHDIVTNLKNDYQTMLLDQEKKFQEKIKKLETLTPIVGSIMHYSSGKDLLEDKDIPYGWILCDGRNLKISDYPELYSIIGKTYGQSDSNNFNIPDLRGRVLIGTGKGAGLSDFKIGQQGGEEIHYLTQNEIPSHSHSINAKFMYINSGNVFGNGFSVSVKMPYRELDGAPRWQSWQYPNTGPDSLETRNLGGNAPHNNMQPYVSIHPIIKAK